MTNKELKEEIFKWMENEKVNQKKFFSIPINKIVEFNKKGIKHAVSRSYKYPKIELKIIKEIPKILPNSFYMGFDKNTKKGFKNVKGVHNYFDIVLFEGDLYEVWFKVKETRDKTYFYDHGIIKKM